MSVSKPFHQCRYCLVRAERFFTLGSDHDHMIAVCKFHTAKVEYVSREVSEEDYETYRDECEFARFMKS